MFSLMHAGRVIEERLETALNAVGLSVPKFSVLSQLVSEREPLPLSELANRLSCVRSNITQLVDRLEADGLVRRVDDPADRRSVRAELTPSGRQRHAAGELAVERVQSRFVAELVESDRRALGRVLAALE